MKSNYSVYMAEVNANTKGILHYGDRNVQNTRILGGIWKFANTHVSI